MVFGIDLGTTNSLIGNGEVMYSGLVSSNVDIKARKQVGRDVVGEDIISSYKTDMTTSEIGRMSQICSSIVLRELADQASRRSGEDVKDVVISVPAYFSAPQRSAVKIAATEAGLNVQSLINEPTAAALYVCRDVKDLVVVYDLGGGTFDISLVDSRVGTYSVIATDGTILGGDDLDTALANEVIRECKIPVRYRGGLWFKHIKSKMRLAKEAIQKSMADTYVEFNDIGIDATFVLKPDRYKEIVENVFGKTIEMTQRVIDSNIQQGDTAKIIFVGGSGQDPFLKELIHEEIDLEEIPCDVAPDLIVAKGAALYAKMVEEGVAMDLVQDVTKRICIEGENGKTITFIESDSIIPITSTRTLNNIDAGEKLELKMYQGDSLLISGCEYIGTLIYEYGRWVPAKQGDVNVTIKVNLDGTVTLHAEEMFSDIPPQEIKLQLR